MLFIYRFLGEYKRSGAAFETSFLPFSYVFVYILVSWHGYSAIYYEISTIEFIFRSDLEARAYFSLPFPPDFYF